MTIHELLVGCRNAWSKRDLFGYDPEFILSVRVVPYLYCKVEDEKNYCFQGNYNDYDEYQALADLKVSNWIFESLRHISIVVILDDTIL